MSGTRPPSGNTPPIGRPAGILNGTIVDSNLIQGPASEIVYRVAVQLATGGSPIIVSDVKADGVHIFGDDIDVYPAPQGTDIQIDDYGYLKFKIHEHEKPVMTDCEP